MSQRDDAEGFHCHSFGLGTAISNPMGHLPAAVGAFFNAASKAGYRVREGKEQVMLFAASGAKVGGWNKRWGHWYVSRVIAEGRDALMLRHGF